MTVDELIITLKELSSEGHGKKDVLFSYNYSDHWNTLVAEGVNYADVTPIEYSEYHQMHKVVEHQDEDDEETNYTEAVVLS